MKLTLILGPMKSGKSFDLISFFSPLGYSETRYALYQPKRNVRDATIASRCGLVHEATKVTSLKEILGTDDEVIGIDEIHMFLPEEVVHIKALLQEGKEIVVSGLDMDYRGHMFEVVKRLLELGPTEVKYRKAVCKHCRKYIGTHTQIFNHGVPVTEGLPSVIPDDGTVTYEPVCLSCFVPPRQSEA